MPAPSQTPEGIPAGAIVESDALQSAPLWRREPYLLLFPLGACLSWAGVLHWLLHALGILEPYKPVFHSLVQIEAFLMSFAVGFLYTMIPRRTGSAPPSVTEMVVAVAAPPAVALAAWNGRWLLSQLAWLALALVVIAFAVRRFLSQTSRRRPPNAFVWIPLSLAMGIAGSVAVAASDWLDVRHAWVLLVGRGLLLQGMFTGLVLGVGSLALPLMTRGEAPPDAGSGPRELAARAAHVAGALLLAASFWIGPLYSLRLALLLRAVIVLVVLLAAARLWRRPRPAWNARVIWVAAWMIPAGYLVAAAIPEQFRAGLHLTFIGGFALLALAVSTQVVLGHGGRSELMLGRPWPVLAIAALVLAAAVARVVMQLDADRPLVWMAVAASLFLAATLVWGAFLVPGMVRRARGSVPS